ncbi:sensor histidine kinase [Clostridium fermenticellae]|nr:HAMP domain-containing sensor histidine kinase [Clostridium fermenticellae]
MEKKSPNTDDLKHTKRRNYEKNKITRLQNIIKKQNEVIKETLNHDKIRIEFFANLSHEFRTPLNLIFNSLQLCNVIIKRDNLDESKKLTTYINIINQNCYRLIRLTNNMIDMTKIDAGFSELNLDNFNIINIVENITLSVVEYVRNKGINLTFDTNVEEKIMACDADKIERIILNLISNAIKFTEQGGYLYVTVTDMGRNVKISVKDTGTGIPKEKLNGIFKRFVQAGKPCKSDQAGSGIGLCLVKSFVEMHGGTIDVKSRLGCGTEFIIDLPVKTIENKKTVHDTQFNYDDKIDRINIEFSDIYV